MKNIKLSLIIGLIFTLTIGITVYAVYDPLESSRAKDKLNYSILQDTQFQLKQLENELSEMKSLEKKDLKTYCLGVQSTAIIALNQDNPATPEQIEKWESLKIRSCENYYVNTLKEVYSSPSDLYYIFLKNDGVYETQNVREHMARSGYVAMDIATGGSKLNVRAPSFMPDKNTDLEMEYTVKIVKNYDTMGLTVELYFEYEGVKYNWAIGHMNTLAEGIEDGAIVKTGDILGLNGGIPSELKFNEKSTGAHVHLELRKDGSPIAFPEWKYTQHHGEDGKLEIEPTAEAGSLVTCKKLNVDEDQQKYVRIASEVSQNDIRFLALLNAENGQWTPDRKHNDGIGFGFCGISRPWHNKIIDDKRFLTDPKWQIEQCYRLWKGGTKFYGNIDSQLSKFECK